MMDWHFLRPYWLLLLPVAWSLVVYLYQKRSAQILWRRVVSEKLLPHVLKGHGGYQRWPYVWLAVAWSLAVLILAGPSFHQTSLPSYREQGHRVVVVSLSSSMNATDVAPSRLKRAQFKLLDVIAKSAGESLGLVVFASAPYVVSPMTEDGATLKQFVQSLSTDLMPETGHEVASGLQMAVALFKRAKALSGRILLITDGSADAEDMALAKKLMVAGIRLDVIGVGSDAGAPIPTPQGFLQDDQGQVMMARLDQKALSELARSGGGRYVLMSADDSDVDAILSQSSKTIAEPTTVDAVQWHDDGVWLLIPLIMMALMGFRRGWFEAI